METKQISEYFRHLPANYLPPSTTRLVVEKEGEVQKVPIGVLGEAIELTPTPSDSLLQLREAITALDKDANKPHLVRFKGAYTRALIVWFEEGSDTSTGTAHCWDLTKRKSYTAKSVILPAVSFEEFFSEEYEVALGSASGNGLLDLSITWNHPSNTLSVITDAITTAELLNISRRIVIQIWGYGSALLICTTSALSDGTWNITARNLYNGKSYEAKNVNPSDITLSSFLSDEYEVPADFVPHIQISTNYGDMISVITDAMGAAGIGDGTPTVVSLIGYTNATLLVMFSWRGGDYYETNCLNLRTMATCVGRTYDVSGEPITTLLGNNIPAVFRDIDTPSLLPQTPDENAIYRTHEITGAKWVKDREIVTDGSMMCYVVDELPEVGEACYTGTSMCSYFRRSTYSAYGYVDANLSSMMGMPVGWYSASTLFSALGYTFADLITSLDQLHDRVDSDDYFLLLELTPKLHCWYQALGTTLKATIPTEESIKAYIEEIISKRLG